MIYLASDHKGFELKEEIKSWLAEWGFEYKDFGPFSLDPNDDYPDFVSKAAEAISLDSENSYAIILGSTGQGEAMVANRYEKVRAAVYYGGQKDIIKLSKEHNNANILSLGASFIDKDETKESIKLWLDTPFSEEERHKRRIEKIDKKE